MKNVFTLAEATENPAELSSSLTLINMKYNYPDFVKEHGHDEADVRMERLYGQHWITHREHLWFWFDNDFYRDEEGNVHV